MKKTALISLLILKLTFLGACDYSKSVTNNRDKPLPPGQSQTFQSQDSSLLPGNNFFGERGYERPGGLSLSYNLLSNTLEYKALLTQVNTAFNEGALFLDPSSSGFYKAPTIYGISSMPQSVLPSTISQSVGSPIYTFRLEDLPFFKTEGTDPVNVDSDGDGIADLVVYRPVGAHHSTLILPDGSLLNSSLKEDRILRIYDDGFGNKQTENYLNLQTPELVGIVDMKLINGEVYAAQVAKLDESDHTQVLREERIIKIDPNGNISTVLKLPYTTPSNGFSSTGGYVIPIDRQISIAQNSSSGFDKTGLELLVSVSLDDAVYGKELGSDIATVLSELTGKRLYPSSINATKDGKAILTTNPKISGYQTSPYVESGPKIIEVDLLKPNPDNQRVLHNPELTGLEGYAQAGYFFPIGNGLALTTVFSASSAVSEDVDNLDLYRTDSIMGSVEGIRFPKNHAPIITVNSPSAGGIYSNPVIADWSVSDPDNDAVTCEQNIDRINFTSVICGEPIEMTFSLGTQTWSLKATDAVGNITQADISFTVQ